MYLLIKPVSGACNLRCRYCFYADEMINREQALRRRMSADSFDLIAEKAFGYLDTLPREQRTLSFGFQGGEPMLAGPDFFRHAAKSVREKNTGKYPVSFFIQTNGTLIDEEWADFFAAEHFLVGLSLDGVPENHDANRITPEENGTHAAVLRAARALKKAGAQFNILTVLTGQTARNGQKIYNYYQKQGFVWQQYIPCLAPLGGEETPWTLSAERYGDFLCRVFDLWYADLGTPRQVYNREFENWIGILAGIEPEDCGMRGVCSPQYLIESDGSVYPCDFYALDEYAIGSLFTDSFEQIEEKRRASDFIGQSRVLPEECRNCRWLPLCRGGCRRNRDENGKNRFCAAYLRFFGYAYPRMERAAAALLRQRGRR